MMEFVALFRWVFVLGILTVLGAPLSAVVFRPLSRRGAAFSLPVALVVLAITVFWFGQLTYGRATVVAGVLVVAALSGVAYRYSEEPDWRAVGGGFGVFLVGFTLYVLYAAHDAAITSAGGEQFLHYGLTNALMATDALPPEDFWFAGEPIRYYYGTQLQVASLSLLAGTPLRHGYYLGLGAFYGLLFVTAYGLVGSVLAARDRSYHLGGTFGAFFVAIAGFTTAFLRLAFESLPGPLQSKEAIFGLLVPRLSDTYEDALSTQGTVDGWFWWDARYVIEDGLFEFPLYSFVKADLHGHTLSTGYVLLAAALAYSYFRTPADQRRRRLALLYVGLGGIAGLFGFMNTWSLPTAVGLGWLALAGAEAHPGTLLGTDRLSLSGEGWRRVADEGWRLVLAAALAIPIGIVGVLIASPFLFTGVPTNEGIGVLPPQSPVGQFLAVYSGLLVVLAALVGTRAVRASADDQRRVGVAVAVGVTALSIAALLVDHRILPDTLAVVGPLLVAGWWLVRTDRLGYEGVLLVGGLGLLLSMDLVHANVWPPQRVRWNTTLKVAVQGWTITAAAAGAAAAILVGDAVGRLDSLRTSETDSQDREGDEQSLDVLGVVRTATPAVLALLLVASVVVTSLPFAALAYNNNVRGEPTKYLDTPTEGSIDALNYHDRRRGAEMEALYWLDDQGSPTIVEAPSRAAYGWKSVASVFTSANAVVGWSHQSGYRGTEAFDARASNVTQIYNGPWERAVATLRKHDVEYIYVGPAEEELKDLLRNFDTYSGVSVAFETDAVTIYAVDTAELDPSESITNN
jgi:YYY domain-containing protein